VEVRLPLGLSIEFDALYRHSATPTCWDRSETPSQRRSSGIGSFRWSPNTVPSKIVRPYVEAGVAWDTLTGLKNTVTEEVAAHTPTRL